MVAKSYSLLKAQVQILNYNIDAPRNDLTLRSSEQDGVYLLYILYIINLYNVFDSEIIEKLGLTGRLLNASSLGP